MNIAKEVDFVNLDNFIGRIKEMGLTMKAVSEGTGIATTVLSDWKNGKAVPTVAKFELVADYLDCSIDYLIGRTERKVITEYGGTELIMKKSNRSMNRFVGIVLEIADFVDRKGEENSSYFPLNELGYGYLALSGYLRDGIKSVIDLQTNYSNLKADNEYLKISEKEMKNFLFDMFGVEEIECINDEYKAKIRKFISEQIMANINKTEG